MRKLQAVPGIVHRQHSRLRGGTARNGGGTPSSISKQYTHFLDFLGRSERY